MQRPRSRLDLLEQYVYFGEQSGVELAERYVAAVEETCSRLAAQPESGRLYDSGIRHLRGMRRCPVAGFEKYLIFYIPGPSGIDLIRVLQGPRDIERLALRPKRRDSAEDPSDPRRAAIQREHAIGRAVAGAREWRAASRPAPVERAI
jgi:toxin ParE1/3/4